MTEREIYITLEMRHVSMGDPVYSKGIKERVKHFSHAYESRDWKHDGHPTYGCNYCGNCRQCWDKYIKMFIQNKEAQCNL